MSGWKAKLALKRRVRAKTRTGYALASCTLDGKPVVQLRIGRETMTLDADDVENLRVQLEVALIAARDMGGEV